MRHKYTPEQQLKVFWSRVNKDGSIPAHMPHLGKCWEWTAAKTYGYGNTQWKGKTAGAHRVSWIIAHGEIPDGLWILHECDNPACVRPSHLRLGTCQENIDDRVRKGRGGINIYGSRRKPN